MDTRSLTHFVLAGALLSAGCGTDSASPTGPGAPSAPVVPSATEVVSVSPQGGATNVDPTAPFSIGFNGAMMPGMEQYVDLHRGDVSGPAHPVACAWAADYTNLTCTPVTPLDPATRYSLHIGGAMRGANGEPVGMEPGTWMGAWAQAGGPMGPGMMDGSTMRQLHAGEPWTMMGPGWRHANGTYGMVLPFYTS